MWYKTAYSFGPKGSFMKNATGTASSTETDYPRHKSILATFAPGKPMRFADVNTALEIAGTPYADPTVRNCLSLMTAAGQLLRVRPGIYALPGYTSPALGQWVAEATKASYPAGVTARYLRDAYRIKHGRTLTVEAFKIELDKLVKASKISTLGADGYLHRPNVFA